MKVEGERITEISRNEKTVDIPSAARYIGQCACIKSKLKSLNLEGSNIIIIGEYTFAHCFRLNEVIFPSCLQEICSGAFCDCYNLMNIKFGTESKLKIIGDKAFRFTKLCNIEFPPLLEVIGDSAFFSYNRNRYDLQDTKIRLIGSEAFPLRSSVSLPASVTPKSVINCSNCNVNVDESHLFVKKDKCGYIFANGTIINAMNGARHIFVRRGVEKIGKYCFRCPNLVSLAIPSSVTKISSKAFLGCEKIRFVHFGNNSRLNKIGKRAFSFCKSLKMINFPKLLKVIKRDAFFNCESLQKVSFPCDSQLERIEGAFPFTKFKHLSLPPSIREIDNVCYIMEKLESVYVMNDLYASSRDGTMILSPDGSEFICCIPKYGEFKIPDGVCVIRKNASLKSNHVFIPASVEVIEEKVFNGYLSIIEFEQGSKLRSLDFEAFVQKPKSFVINNENFITMDDGVVVSLNPRGIVFAPSMMKNLDVDKYTEVIYSRAFEHTEIPSLHLPKSLKRIHSHAFHEFKADNFTFEDGTELEFLGEDVFKSCSRNESCLSINGKLYKFGCGFIELPPDFSPCHFKSLCTSHEYAVKVTCPRSSLLTLAQQSLVHFGFRLQVNEDQL